MHHMTTGYGHPAVFILELQHVQNHVQSKVAVDKKQKVGNKQITMTGTTFLKTI